MAFLLGIGLCFLPSNPSIDRSSSIVGQDMPYPEGDITKLFKSSGDAPLSRLDTDVRENEYSFPSMVRMILSSLKCIFFI